jgi:Zn ribbon nucleic-acid-binding protein
VLQKLKYFAWAASRMGGSQACPGCEGSDSFQVKRKYLVTTLRECLACGLRFRVPLEEESASNEFYQSEYKQGFGVPSDEALGGFLARGFSGTEKDFSSYIQVLRAAGLKDGDALLDFGCSWGYGSWQFRQAGFRVYSYEVSRPRAEYARTKLACTMVDPADRLPEPVQCMFSAHVIEHLPDPKVIWQVGQAVLASDGFIACFCPNGNPSLQSQAHYHQLWGKVHPLMITPKFFHEMSRRQGFSSGVYTSPYPLTEVAAGRTSNSLEGAEICLIARKETS